MNVEINFDVFKSFPYLESERLILREFRFDDASGLFAIRSNAEVMRYMDTAFHLTEHDSLKMIEGILRSFDHKTGMNWALEEKASGEFIGYIGFWRLITEHVRAEIGYALNPKMWGKGYMSEAAKAVLDFGFNGLNLHSVEANVNQKNISSIQLLEKLFFVKEAQFRENYFYDGKFYDSIIYSLLESDWYRLNE